MTRELRGVGVDRTRFSFFDAYSISGAGRFRSVGSHGCFLSHLEILCDAAAAGESVLILQDDCALLPDARQYLLPPCDIFYGGFEASDPARPEVSDIVGAHFMGFSAKAANLASRYLLSLLHPATAPDQQAAAEPSFNPRQRPPIDGALVWFRRAYPELTTVFAKLSYQRSSRSDVTPHRLDRWRVLQPFVAAGRQVKRALNDAA